MIDDINNDRTNVIQVKEWFWTLLLLYIPIIGLIFMAYWIFSKKTNLNKKNLMIASAMIFTMVMFLVFFIPFYLSL